MADFASMLKYLREREGLSQRELASKVGLSASTIGMYESGKRHPRPEEEELLADFFNVDLNILRGRRVDENNVEKQLIEAYKQSPKIQELLSLYKNATPEAQAAVDLLLKASQQNP